MKNVTVIAFTLISTLPILGCSSSSSRSAQRQVIGQEHGQQITQTELQQDIQRFSTRFSASINDAMIPLMSSPSTHTRKTALSKSIAYHSSALDIATGISPEANLLDMIVFITLECDVVRNHWVPTLYHQDGRALLKAFGQSEREIWEIANKVMNTTQEETLKNSIHSWQEENPGRVNVAGVRFQQFSTFAGRSASRDIEQTSGLLSNIKQATLTADQAVLVAERGLFLAQRMPFLLRLQALATTQDISADASQSIALLVQLLGQTKEMKPLIHDLLTLTYRANNLLSTTERLLDRWFPQSASPSTGARRGPSSVDESHDLVATIISDVDNLARRLALYFLLAGLGLTISFWTGYWLVKRRSIS